jgi:hypothetical protein
MRICGTSADCPPWLDACTEIRDPTGSTRPPKVCTCTSAKICSSHTNGFTCNPSDNLCEPYCETSQDCSGFRPPRVCDKFSGLCQISTSSCSGNADCTFAAQPRCDPVILQCVGCVSPSDCAGRADGFTQCSPTGACMSPS